MKYFLISLVFFTILSACSSHEKERESVNKMAQSYDPITEREAQLQRVISMIRNDKELDEKRKDELVNLVNDKYKKSTKVIEEQGQLRALLVNQLLEGSHGKNTKVIQTTKRLEELHKKNIKELNDFIIKFRSISGERDLRQSEFMREVGEVHLL